MAIEHQYHKQAPADPKIYGRVAVLLGGTSAEREVSLQSGQAVVEGLTALGVDCEPVDLQHDVVEQLQALSCDRAFIALHGAGGEDGRIQALLEWLGIPYTGSDVTASALAMNKLTAKAVWQGLDMPTPNFEVLHPSSDWMSVLESLGGECFVKPVCEGSSIGMRCVSDASALQAAFEYAQVYDRQVIAEQRIVGREYTVALLNGHALLPIELKANRDFYDYEAKYIADDTQYFCPCDLSDKKQRALMMLAVDAFEVLGGRGWGRVDFMGDADSNMYLLEANTVPGMTSHSLVPMAATASGLTFGELLLEILTQTL